MLRTIIIIVASLGVTCAAYLVYQWQDSSPELPPVTAAPDVPIESPLHSTPGTQPAGIDIRGNKVAPGVAPIVHVIDPQTGEAKIVLKATQWQPISDTTFLVFQPTARVLLPGGQLAYVRADEGEVTVQRDDRNNYNPKRGKLTGHVQLVIDKTEPEWRRENPELAAPEQHPEAVVKIWMDDVSFDLDLARLQTEGPITVQSTDATVEGEGLTLVWNEENRRIKLLRIERGKRATIHMDSLVKIGVGGSAVRGSAVGGSAVGGSAVGGSAVGDGAESDEGAMPDRATAEAAAMDGNDAQAAAMADGADGAGDGDDGDDADDDPAIKVPTGRGDGTSARIKLTDLGDEDRLIKPDRIDTYHVVFKDNIVAEQRQGIRLIGSLSADVLELLRDFGARERAAVEHADGGGADSDSDNRPDKRSERKQAKRKLEQRPEGNGKGDSDGSDGSDGGGSGGGGSDGGDGLIKEDSTLVLRWSGPLVVTPKTETTTQPEQAPNRFHVVAEGNPVQIHDREAGDVTCRRLEYHDESQSVWLTGTPDDFVTLQADADRQIAGEKIFLNRKTGIARVEGAGRMTDARSDDERQGLPPCIRDELRKSARTAGRPATRRNDQDADRNVMVTWQKGVEIQFGLQQFSAPDPAGGPPGTKSEEYLKSATFTGNVSFAQGGQMMSAEQIDVVFNKPTDAGGGLRSRSVSAETIHARGNVRMVNDQSTITCDRLEVDMTTNDVGDNVPALGRAYGNVMARQGSQEIRASDEMVVTLESVPTPTDPTERQRYEAAAVACGYSPDSPEWQTLEARLSERRETVVRRLEARGEIAVRDPEDQVDVAADTLECTLDDAQQITRALVMGSEVKPAHVSMTDFYVRGPQIRFNVLEQSADVPGEGILRFYTKQDISGRRVDEPVPVVVSWKRGMSFRGGMNTGMFTGSVRAVSENTVLDCRELNLRFEPLPRPPAATRPADDGPDPRWIAGRVIDLLTNEGPDDEGGGSATGLSRDVRKRLVYIQAVGDCTIASSEYARPDVKQGPFAYLLAGVMPELASDDAKPAKEDQRLQSFVRIAGPRVTIDLDNEHMVVEGAGNLLVLDYRLPEPGKRTGRQRDRAAGGIGGSDLLAGSLRSSGPSQTVFTWQNSMSYLNRRNVAVLDNQVVMKHAAGSQMAMPEQVAAALKVDPRELAAAKGRRAELTCENLVVEFARAREDAAGGGTGALSAAVQLEAFQASQRVRMQENNRAIEGELVTYDSGTGMVRILGSPQLPAWGAEIDERTGALRASYRAQELEWNLETGVITSRGASVTASGR